MLSGKPAVPKKIRSWIQNKFCSEESIAMDDAKTLAEATDKLLQTLQDATPKIRFDGLGAYEKKWMKKIVLKAQEFQSQDESTWDWLEIRSSKTTKSVHTNTQKVQNLDEKIVVLEKRVKSLEINTSFKELSNAYNTRCELVERMCNQETKNLKDRVKTLEATVLEQSEKLSELKSLNEMVKTLAEKIRELDGTNTDSESGHSDVTVHSGNE